MADQPLRLAMWSGPRNISTALMRSWGSRRDTFVCDEPLYAHYLAETGLAHPGAEEVIAHHDTDWRRVVEWLTGPVPHGRRIFYQKQMSHHLLPHMGRDWLAGLTHAFLIRQPRQMLASLGKFLPRPTLADTGLPQQVELFEWVERRTDRAAAVVDSRDILQNPRQVLSRLCGSAGVPFDEAMLSWEPGLRATDGIWAKHWYAEVVNTTTFGPYRGGEPALDDHLEGLLEQCQPLYDALYRHRIA
ncbi:MAG: hypothetical protein WD278_09105 [Pirellulales bacterium]